MSDRYPDLARPMRVAWRVFIGQVLIWMMFGWMLAG